MRKITSLADVQIVLNDLLNQRDYALNHDRNTNGFQIKNTGAATEPTDVVILSQLSDAVGKKSSPPVEQKIKIPSWANILNVKDYGAIGNGKNDDTLAVQNCLNAVTTGSVVVFPPSTGAYKIKTVTVRSNTVLTGGGIIDIIDDATVTGNSIFIDSVSNVWASNLQITSVNALSRTGVYGNIRILNAKNIQVSGCTNIGGSSTFIHVINSTNLLFENNSVFETWADGIHVSRGSSRVRILNNYFEHTGDDPIGLVGYISLNGITSYPPMSDIVVSGNNIYNITKGFGRGISCYGSIGVVISNNTIDTTFDAGILVGAVEGSDPTQATHYCYKVDIANNVTKNNNLAGVYVSFARGVKVHHNFIDNSSADGISIASVCKEITVCDNDVNGTQARGIIAFQVSSSDPRLIQELFTTYGDPGLTTVGISDIIITNNRVRNTINEAITCQGEQTFPTERITIVDNEVPNAVTRGIFTQDCNHVSISGNQILSPTQEGILCFRGSYFDITRNQVTAGKLIGLSLVTMNYCGVTGANIILGCGGGIYVGPTSGHNYVTGNMTLGNTGFQVQLDLTNPTNIKFNNFGDDWTGLYFNWPRVENGPNGGPLNGFLINNLKFVSGIGNPNGIVAAPVGSYYLRGDSVAYQNFYIKQDGSLNTGWVQQGTPEAFLPGPDNAVLQTAGFKTFWGHLDFPQMPVNTFTGSKTYVTGVGATTAVILGTTVVTGIFPILNTVSFKNGLLLP